MYVYTKSLLILLCISLRIHTVIKQAVVRVNIMNNTTVVAAVDIAKRHGMHIILTCQDNGYNIIMYAEVTYNIFSMVFSVFPIIHSGDNVKIVIYTV